MRAENVFFLAVGLLVFGALIGTNAKPMQRKACTNVDCSCELNGGECLCEELWPDDGCECKAEPEPPKPEPAPFPPKPDPVPDVTPDEIDPPKPKPPKAEAEVKEIILHSRDNCPPCDSWWFNERPKFEAEGWKVCLHVLRSDEPGLSPFFTVEVDGKRVELKGYQTIDSVRRAIQ